MQAISQKEFEGAIRKVANEGHAVKSYLISGYRAEIKFYTNKYNELMNSVIELEDDNRFSYSDSSEGSDQSEVFIDRLIQVLSA